MNRNKWLPAATALLTWSCANAPHIELLSPADGLVLEDTADLDLSVRGIQLDALVEASGEAGALVIVQTSRDELFTAPLSFEGVLATDGRSAVRVTLPAGAPFLRACTDAACKHASKPIRVVASSGVGTCPYARFVSPRGKGTGTLLLEPDDDTALEDGTCGATFAPSVRAAIDADDGTAATLFIDNVATRTVVSSGGVLDFGAVVLGVRGEQTSSLHIELEGSSCVVALPEPIAVRCGGPSCTLAAPTTERFVNATFDADDAHPGLDLDLTARSGAGVGQTFTLRRTDTGETLASAPASSEGVLAEATFRSVPLAEGRVMLEAACRDETQETRSASMRLDVDTVPCLVTVDSPTNGQALSDLDDLDHDLANGIQIEATLGASGDECVETRVAACSMLDAVAYAPIGAAHTLSLGTTGTEALCAEVRDQAGNVGSQSIDVFTQLTSAPTVDIVYPTPSTRVNRAGGSFEGTVYDADANPATPACEIGVEVACSAIGVLVELSVDGSSSTRVAPCLTDPSHPASGVARFEDVSIPASIVFVHTLVAQQTVGGFVGTSRTIAFGADCAPPPLEILAPPCGSTLSPASDVSPRPGVQTNVTVTAQSAPPIDVELRVTHPGEAGEVVAQSLGSQLPPNTAQRVVPGVDVGGAGTVHLVAEARDAFANLARTEVCSMTVAGVPEVALDALTTTRFNPANTPALDCNPSNVGFDLFVSGKTSAAVGSNVTLQIGEAAPVTTSVASGLPRNTFAACVPAPEGRSAVSARVEDGVAVATALPIEIHVRSVALTHAIDDVTVEIIDRRAGVARLSFTALGDEEAPPSSLTRYAVRCSDSPITTALAYAMAAEIAVDAHVPASPGLRDTITIRGIRTGTTPVCVVRGEDAAGNVTPLPSGDTQAVVAPQFLVYTIDATRVNGGMGSSGARAAGDVNGDGFADFVVSGQASAYLVLGRAGGEPPVLTTTFTKQQTSIFFGSVVRGVGDVNDDGIDDIAIADPVGAALGLTGEVYVLYGRTSWPTELVLDETRCDASFCVRPGTGSMLGADVAGLGDFDGARGDDIAIAMPQDNAVIVLSGGIDIASGTTFQIGEDMPRGLVITRDSEDGMFGVSLGAPGQIAGSPLTDLVIAEGDLESTQAPSKLYRVTGRALGDGLTVLDPSELVRIGADASSGDGIATSIFFGSSFGDFDGDGFVDLSGRATTHGAYVSYGSDEAAYPFASATKVTFASALIDPARIATSRGVAYDPPLGHIGDLDGDGADELLLGAVSVTNLGTHSVALVYGAHTRAAVELGFSDVPSRSAVIAPVAEPHPAGTPRPSWHVAFVGDVIRDSATSYRDLLVTDPGTSDQSLPGERGRVFVVY